MATAQSSCCAQKPGGRPPVADYLRWHEEDVGSHLRQLRRRRPCLVARLLISALVTGFFAPCIALPPPGDGTGYCDQLRPLYPWVTLIATIGLLVLIWSVAEAVATLFITPRLRRRQEATIRLLVSLKTGYGTIPPLEELEKTLDPAVMCLLVDLGLTQQSQEKRAAQELSV